MLVDRTGENRLKITLSAIEICDYFGSFKDIRYDNPRARSALGDILLQATDSKHFLSGKERLYIRVFPTRSGGCIIYFLAEGHTKDEYAVLQFACTDDMLSACKQLSLKKKNTVVEIYESGGLYRIIMPAAHAAGIEAEFAEMHFSEASEREKTREHWHKICDGTPVDKIFKQ